MLMNSEQENIFFLSYVSNRNENEEIIEINEEYIPNSMDQITKEEKMNHLNQSKWKPLIGS